MNSLNIIAHPDDDLLFLNPDIQEDILKGNTVYNIYLTAGDDGFDKSYFIKRRDAITDTYIQHFAGYKYNLIFLGIKSNSFRTGDVYGDLYTMWSNKEYIGRVVDQHNHNPKSYRQDSLTELLRNMIVMFNPKLIRIQDPDCLASIDHDEPHLDHLDHIYGAKFMQLAAKSFPSIEVYAYEGYPLRYQAPNVSPERMEQKKMMWRTYQSMDTSVGGEIWDIALDKCYKRKIQ